MGNKVFKTRTGDLYIFPATGTLEGLDGELAIIGLDTDDGPEHPLYDDHIHLPISDEFVRNIMTNGILEPIIVTRGPGNLAYVVDGRRRTMGTRIANRMLFEQGAKDKNTILIQAVYKRGDDASMADIVISANEFRAVDDPIAQAKKIQRLLNFGRTHQEIAVTFGLTVTTIKNRIALLESSPEVKAAIDAGRIKPSAALQIAKLPKEKQPAALDKTIAAGGDKKPSVRQAKAAASGSTEPAKSKRMRGRAEIELVMAHHPAELNTMTGTTALRWVLGHIEIEELKLPA
jgi:ParB family transcriptional regulator, chromosome partitioning protein